MLSQEKATILQRAATNKLASFAEVINPKFESVWFHELISNKLGDVLEKVKQKKKVRLIITIPPRHGKTLLTATYFPAWALGKHPDLQFILSTYGAELSEKTGMKTRDVIDSEVYQSIFPGITLRPDQKAKAKWQTNRGGSFTAVGIGGAITGIGGDVILIDDPHKDRAEAESELMRERVWEYYQSTLYSRLEGHGAVILIMQRWHTDDLVGRILEESARLKAAGEPHDEWEIINFAAIAEEADEFRKKGEPLWPNKFPLEVLANIKAKNLYNWCSQYQQDPILQENQAFRESMFKYFDEEIVKAKYVRYTTTVDPAGFKKKSDENVILTVAKEVTGPNWYVVDIIAGVFDPGKVIDSIFMQQAKFGTHDVYIEGVAYQSTLKWHVEERQRKDRYFFMVHEFKPKGAKEDRIKALLPLFNAGIIYFRKHMTTIVEQFLKFPRGKHDDQCDALAMQLHATENTGGGLVSQYKKKHNGYFRNK